MGQKLHFRKFGSGSKILIALHGFGQDHRAFLEYPESLRQSYTVYLFDLFYHGKSKRPDQKLRKSDWNTIFKSFLESEGIDTFSLLTFSLGGRFAIATLHGFPNRVTQMILLAPDGFKISGWYRMATHPLSNWLFKTLMKNERLFNSLLVILEKSHLATNTLVRFARKELDSPARRIQVYRTWTYFRSLQFDLDDIAEIFSTGKAQVHIVLGTRDSIITETTICPLIKGMKNTQVHLIDAKHNQMIAAGQNLAASLLNGE